MSKEQQSEEQGVPPLRLPSLLGTAESGEVRRDLGYEAIISLDHGVKCFTRAEVFELRDWLTAVLDYRHV